MGSVLYHLLHLGGDHLVGRVFSQNVGDKVKKSFFHYFCKMGNEVNGIGKILIVTGLILVLVGTIFILSGKFPGIKSIPGDMVIKKENFTFYFPLGTSILISLLLTLFFYLWRKFGG